MTKLQLRLLTLTLTLLIDLLTEIFLTKNWFFVTLIMKSNFDNYYNIKINNYYRG